MEDKETTDKVNTHVWSSMEADSGGELPEHTDKMGEIWIAADAYQALQCGYSRYDANLFYRTQLKEYYFYLSVMRNAP